MYGKHYKSMYTGSMIGMGTPAFAVMGYVLSNMQPNPAVGAQVELNPRLLAFIFGEDESVISKAIEKLCEPDPRSRTKDEEGRRLVRIGEFDYRVINGVKYIKIRNDEERMEANRQRQADHRAKLNMTPEERERFDAGRNEEYGKRRKPIGLRAAKRMGQIAGGTEAVADGLAEAKNNGGGDVS